MFLNIKVILLNTGLIYKIIALFITFTFSQEIYAVSCTVNTPSVTINAGTFTVQRDTAIGQSISNSIAGPSNKIISCTTNYERVGGMAWRSVTPLSTYGGDGVFTTGVTGIGTRIGSTSTINCPYVPGGSLTTTYYFTSSQTSRSFGGCGNINSNVPFTYYVQTLFELIKTANSISSGTINIKIAEMYSTGTANFATIPVYLTATVNVLACSVSTPNVNVTLPVVNANSFTGVGHTQGDTPFTVGLQCDAGAKINATLNFTQDNDTTNQSVAAVTGKGSAGVASGVGIQLLYGSTPLKNNILTLLKTSGGGVELPAGAFTARYFQTKNSVQPGNANTTATMTLTYQ